MQEWLSGDGPTGIYVVVGTVAHTLLVTYAVLTVAANVVRRLAPKTYVWARGKS